MESFAKALNGLSRISVDVVKSDVLTNLTKNLDFIPASKSSIAEDLFKTFRNSYFKVSDNIVKFEPPNTNSAIKSIDDFNHLVRNGEFFEFYKSLTMDGKIQFDPKVTSKTFQPVEQLFQRTYPDKLFNKISIDDFKRVDDFFEQDSSIVNNIPKSQNELKILYEQNTKFKNIIDKLDKKPKSKLKTFLITLTIGGGVLTLLASIYQASQNMAGCWRYYNENGKTKSCKISQASCKYNSVICQCQQIPQGINDNLCESWDESKEHSECRKCDPNAKSDSAQYLDSKEFISPFDIYRCRGPGTVGEILANVAHVIPSIINTSTDIVSDIFALVKYGIIGLVFITIIVILYRGYQMFLQSKTTAREDYENSPINRHLFEFNRQPPPPPYNDYL